MLISMSTFIVAAGVAWKSVGSQLLASGVLMLSGYQDVVLGTRIGATFWFYMALAFGISALVTAFGRNFGAAL